MKREVAATNAATPVQSPNLVGLVRRARSILDQNPHIPLTELKHVLADNQPVGDSVASVPLASKQLQANLDAANARIRELEAQVEQLSSRAPPSLVSAALERDGCLLAVEGLQREALLLQWWQMALDSDCELMHTIGAQPNEGGLGSVRAQQLWAFQQASADCLRHAENLSSSVSSGTQLGEVGLKLQHASEASRKCIALASQILPVHRNEVVPQLQLKLRDHGLLRGGPVDNTRHRKALSLLESGQPQLARAAQELLMQDEQLQSYRRRVLFEGESNPVGSHGQRAHKLAESIPPVRSACEELTARLEALCQQAVESCDTLGAEGPESASTASRCAELTAAANAATKAMDSAVLVGQRLNRTLQDALTPLFPDQPLQPPLHREMADAHDSTMRTAGTLCAQMAQLFRLVSEALKGSTSTQPSPVRPSQQRLPSPSQQPLLSPSQQRLPSPQRQGCSSGAPGEPSKGSGLRLRDQLLASPSNPKASSPARVSSIFQHQLHPSPIAHHTDVPIEHTHQGARALLKSEPTAPDSQMAGSAAGEEPTTSHTAPPISLESLVMGLREDLKHDVLASQTKLGLSPDGKALPAPTSEVQANNPS